MTSAALVRNSVAPGARARNWTSASGYGIAPRTLRPLIADCGWPANVQCHNQGGDSEHGDCLEAQDEGLAPVIGGGAGQQIAQRIGATEHQRIDAHDAAAIVIPGAELENRLA